VIQTWRREVSGILPVNPEGGKIARDAAVSPVIETNNFSLPINPGFPGAIAM
jgi:hypothetical protein